MRPATDIFVARRVSPNIRSELEIRSVSVSASDNAEHVANSSFLAEKTNVAKFCNVCNANREIEQGCYMQPLKNVLPPSDRVLYAFCDFETTQNTRYSDTANVHVPNVVCIQQFCSRCESVDDVGKDCEQCGKRKHSFWEDPVVVILSLRIAILGQSDNCNCPECQGVRSAFHIEYSCIFKMASRTYIERAEDFNDEIRTHEVLIDSLRFLPFPYVSYVVHTV